MRLLDILRSSSRTRTPVLLRPLADLSKGESIVKPSNEKGWSFGTWEVNRLGSNLSLVNRFECAVESQTGALYDAGAIRGCVYPWQHVRLPR